MEDEIKLLNTKLDYFEGNLLSAKTKIKTLDKKNKGLEYRLTLEKAETEQLLNGQLKCEKNEFQSHLDQLTSKKVENENLRKRISELEAEKTRLQSDFDQMTVKVEALTNENLNCRNSVKRFWFV